MAMSNVDIMIREEAYTMQYITIKDDVAVLAVTGVFTFKHCKAVSAEITTAIQNGCTKMIVDFINTKYLDSAALRMLCEMREQLHAENFSAKNASGKTLSILRGSNLDAWLKG